MPSLHRSKPLLPDRCPGHFGRLAAEPIRQVDLTRGQPAKLDALKRKIVHLTKWAVHINARIKSSIVGRFLRCLAYFQRSRPMAGRVKFHFVSRMFL